MDLKLNTEAVHTVQLEGKDVEVVPKAEVEGLITQANQSVENVKKETQTQIQRELSKKLGVNVFDENAVNEFIETNKTKVDAAQLDQYKKQVEDLKGYETKYKDLQFDNAILKTNVDDKAIDKVKKLATLELDNVEGDYMKAVEKVVTDFPMFVKGTKRAGIDPNNNPPSKTAYEDYIESNPKLKNNPYLKK